MDQTIKETEGTLPTTDDTTIPAPRTDWTQALESRLRANVEHARNYVRTTNHGAPNHLHYHTIARLAWLLDLAHGPPTEGKPGPDVDAFLSGQDGAA